MYYLSQSFHFAFKRFYLLVGLHQKDVKCADVNGFADEKDDI